MKIDIIDIIGRMKKLCNVKSDTELCDIIKVKRPTFGGWVKRGTIDLNRIIQICEMNNWDLPYVLFDITKENETTVNKNQSCEDCAKLRADLAECKKEIFEYEKRIIGINGELKESRRMLLQEQIRNKEEYKKSFIKAQS